jgi:hypothetical protein
MSQTILGRFLSIREQFAGILQAFYASLQSEDNYMPGRNPGQLLDLSGMMTK